MNGSSEPGHARAMADSEMQDVSSSHGGLSFKGQRVNDVIALAASEISVEPPRNPS
jgi:hypothetical protein